MSNPTESLPLRVPAKRRGYLRPLFALRHSWDGSAAVTVVLLIWMVTRGVLCARMANHGLRAKSV
jgi:hypothetical protein